MSKLLEEVIESSADVERVFKSDDSVIVHRGIFP